MMHAVQPILIRTSRIEDKQKDFDKQIKRIYISNRINYDNIKHNGNNNNGHKNENNKPDIKRNWKTCLIVDDDLNALDYLELFLSEHWKFHVIKSRTYEQAILQIESKKIDLCIIDYRLNGDNKTGLDIIKYCYDKNKILNNSKEVRALLYTAYNNIEIKKYIWLQGLRKPFSLRKLNREIEYLIQE